MINTPTATSTFDQELESVQRMLSGQVLVSQDRCVDALLDLFNAAPNALVRELIGALISDMRFVSAVKADLLSSDLRSVEAYLHDRGVPTVELSSS